MPRIIEIKPGPNPETEQVVPYHKYLPDLLRLHFGRTASRSALCVYLTNGYPVDRGGPYIKMPIFRAMMRPMTTVQAMERFITTVRFHSRKKKVPLLKTV